MAAVGSTGVGAFIIPSFHLGTSLLKYSERTVPYVKNVTALINVSLGGGD